MNFSVSFRLPYLLEQAPNLELAPLWVHMFPYEHMNPQLTIDNEHMNPQLTCCQRQWLHSSVGRASHRYREVTGSNPVEVLNFFSGFFTQLHKLRSLRRSFLHFHFFISFPQFIYDLFHISLTLISFMGTYSVLSLFCHFFIFISFPQFIYDLFHISLTLISFTGTYEPTIDLLPTSVVS